MSIAQLDYLAKSTRRDDESGCWIWLRSTNGLGYGQAYFGGKRTYAHRLVYRWFEGHIPRGLELDHLCRRPLCVNPLHLEPVTHAENIRRSPLIAHHEFCGRGHRLDIANTYVSPVGDRTCKTCRRERERARRRRQCR